MIRVTLDAATAQQVLANGDEVELCDATGVVIARYQRAAERRIADDWPTDEEIQRIINDPRPRLTTEQVLEHLRGLSK